MKKIAIQGITGSFHEMAAKKYFGPDIELLECDTFNTLCVELHRNKVDYAVMAIENTLAGSMLPNYALLREYPFKIIGEVFLHIRMQLMALPQTSLTDIKYVYSHPIAIRQCAEYLSRLPGITIVERNDTAGSAKEIRDNQLHDVAAIAGTLAAELYDLQILERNIETYKKNYTRFLVLALQGNITPENNKASVCFELGHYAGALARVLNILAQERINLTKIQSIPILGKPYEYSFHADLEWDDYPQYEKAIHTILKEVSNLSILGEYKKGSYQLDGETLENSILNL